MKRLYTSLLLGLTLSASLNLAFAWIPPVCTEYCKELAKKNKASIFVIQYAGLIKKDEARLTGLNIHNKPTYTEIFKPGPHFICICALPYDKGGLVEKTMRPADSEEEGL